MNRASKASSARATGNRLHREPLAAPDERGVADAITTWVADGMTKAIAWKMRTFRAKGGIYLSQVGSRHGLLTGGRAGERIGSVGRGRPGCGLTIRLR
jgi:hypothetical protein